MKESRPVRVALSQRICPEWRVPVFRELASRPGIDLTVFFGRGLPTGASRNAEHIRGFTHHQLATIPLHFTMRGVERYRSFHPALAFRVVLGRYDVVVTEPSTNIFNNLVLYPVCKVFGKKFIWYEAGAGEQPSMMRRMIEPLVGAMARGADACVTCNSYADETLVKMGVPRNRIFRAQNTLDTSALEDDVKRFRPQVDQMRRDLGVTDGKCALFVGAIEERKRVGNLIKAVGLLRAEGLDAKAVVVGDGPFQSELQSNLSASERERVVFAGRRVEDVALYLVAADVVVLPGQGGLSIVQAFACGKPFIATPECVAGGTSVRDYIKDGVNGFVVEADNVQALADKMRILFTDPELYETLARGALESSRDLTVERMVDGIEAAIRHAVGGPAP